MDEASETDILDPRGLIRDAYRIDAITPEQCRSIFLDWLLHAADTPAISVQVGALLSRYGADAPDHPMTAVLRGGLEGAQAGPVRRRGGWRGRRAGGRKG